MTDPIQDERLDEYELPGVGWLDCPVLPPTDMLATIKRSDVLDGRSRN